MSSPPNLLRWLLPTALLTSLALLALYVSTLPNGKRALIQSLSGCSPEGRARGLRCPREQGYYWCSTDKDHPVWIWNDGTAQDPVWMIQHYSGQGDGYHDLAVSKCRFSERITNPFFAEDAR